MNPNRVLTQQEVEAELEKLGFTKTTETTNTGAYWKSSKSGKHILVPHPYEGMYPEFILKDLRQRMSALSTPFLH